MLARSVAYNLAGRMGGLLVGFVTSVLLARWLGPSDRGLVGVLVTASGLGMAVFGFGIPSAVTYLASVRAAATNVILGTTLVVTAGLAVVLVPAVWVGSDRLATAFTSGRGAAYWPVAAALVAVTFLDWTTHNQLLARLQFGLFNILTLVARAAALLATVVLVGIAGWGPAGALAATAVLSVTMIAGALPVLLRAGRPRFDRRVLGQLTRYGIRVQAGTLLQSLNYRLDLILLGVFRPLREVGAYFVASFLAELVLLVAQSFESSVVPLVSQAETATARDVTTVNAIRHHVILAVAATAGNLLFAPLVVVVFLGPAYNSALVPFFILSVGMVFAGTGTVAVSDLRGRNRPGTASLFSGIALVATVVGDLALIPPFGAIGAAVVSLVAYTLFGTASIVGLARVTGVPWRRIAVPTPADVAAYATFVRAQARRVTRAPA